MLVPKLRFKREDGTDYPEWKDCILSDYCEEIKASIDPKKYPNDSFLEYSMPAFDMGKIPNNVIGRDMNSNRKVVNYPCVLINKLNVRKKRIWKVLKPMSNSVCSAEFIPVKSDKMSIDFLECLALSDRFTARLLDCSTGTSNSQKRVTPNIIMDMSVSIPCLEEQQKIADFLSAFDEVIIQSEAEVQNLEQQKKSAMQKIFSQELRFKREDGTDYPEWEERELKDVAKILMGQSPSGSSVNTNKNGIPLVQGKADILGYGVISDRYTSTPTKVSEPNDIIMTVRAPVGYVAKLGFTACIGRGVCAIRANENEDFVYYVLQSKESEWKYIEQGSTFTAVNSDDVSSLIVSVPCLEEQQKIADFLSALDEAISYAKQELDKWKELKKGLLQQMFV